MAESLNYYKNGKLDTVKVKREDQRTRQKWRDMPSEMKKSNDITITAIRYLGQFLEVEGNAKIVEQTYYTLKKQSANIELMEAMFEEDFDEN